MVHFEIPKIIHRDQPVSDNRGYTVDEISFMKDGKRILPAMGEFHYSRWEEEGWEEELRKMKAGGITVVATYLFWIHHEEKRGEWNFSGRRNIREFVALCQKVGLQVFLRIGPWVHAEVRNGGFPDWVQWSKEFEPRTNDSGYLKAVETYFNRLGQQLSGMMFQDGGPVIGVQLENEYGHVGGPADPEIRRQHMETLYQLARNAGFVVPYYTATAWGSEEGLFDALLPVLGGYVDAPWDTSTRPMPASKCYLFEPYFNDATIGTDRTHVVNDVSDDISGRKTPYLTAELGSGLQVTSHRRPYVTRQDVEGSVVCTLGSGANLLGYYMYHGGINPEGQYTTLNEEQRIGGYTTLPVKSYDFQAPIGESGRVNESYGALKKWNFLVHDFGSELAEMIPVMPKERPESAEDLSTPRMALRFNPENGMGFLFLNNHQRLRCMNRIQNETICIHWNGMEWHVEVPDIQKDDVACYQIFLDEREHKTKISEGNVFCRLGQQIVLYAENPTESVRENTVILSEQEARRTFLLSDGLYLPRNENSILYEDDANRILLSPDAAETICRIDLNGNRTILSKSVSPAMGKVVFLELLEARSKDGKLLYREYTVKMKFDENAENVNNWYLKLDYDGDRAELYEDGKLLDDWYTTGASWYVNLKRFHYCKELTLRVYDSGNTIPCSFGQDVYYELPVHDGCVLKKAELKPEYRMIV